MIGKTLSHYTILEEISRGGMGIVYRALDTKLDREVALKVLPSDLVADADRRERFVTEAKAAAALEHPHIAVTHDVGEAEGVTYIAMELIRGEKLSDVLERERLPAKRSLDLAVEVAEGLARAHDRGILHRDVKPANVMVTEDGHAKIIDFGLAKLIAPLAGEGSEKETALRKETDPGVVMGTVSYMSPEQARGVKIDHRSDVFSFGIVLYELLAGQPPFRGPTGMDTLQAILKEAPPRLPALGAGVSPEPAYELQRILDKCLAKDPAERYQSMKDLVVDLRAEWRRLHSGPVTAVSAPAAVPARSSKKFVPATAGIAAILALAATLFFLRGSERKDPSPPSGKPSLAVLYFENNTGDPSLDWLRTALTDMLVTDLSQSPRMEILGTETLYQILKEMNRLDERVTSLDVVQEIADRANVDTVLLGSFVKAGDTIRIHVRLQEARSGRILTTERVEGTGESAIFPMVDDLTRRIKSGFDIPRAADADLVRDLKDVTTSSLEAYRYYAEGIRLHDELREEEAIPLFERAVEIDPEFAMAYAKLAIVHRNLFHQEERDEYARRALEHVNRLTARERYYIEGMYYSERPETIRRAMEAYQKGIDLYPDADSIRHNLALIYDELELYDESVPHLEELRRRGMTFPDTHSMLARMYALRGDDTEAFSVLNDYLREHPDNAAGHRNLAGLLINLGRFDEAEGALDRAEALDPGELFQKLARWNLQVLTERWPEAQALARSLQSSSDPFRKWQGSVFLSRLALYRGRSREALRLLEEATTVFPEPGRFSAFAHVLRADWYLHVGDASRARAEARTARELGQGDWPEWLALPRHAIAAARLARREEADRLLEELGTFAASIPGQRFERDVHWAGGEIALAREDTEKALAELERAIDMLPSRGFTGPPPPHVPMWYSYATALLEAGREAEAAEWFRRIADSTTERIVWSVRYVRSLYFLGKIHESRGEREKAREYYRRFVEYWKDGDLDRHRVAEALEKI